MFVIREAAGDDHATLMKLLRMLGPAPLPVEADDVARTIGVSRQSFAGRVAEACDRHFTFALTDTDTGEVVGMSAIRSDAGHSGARVFLRLRKREHYSEDLRTGHVHTTLQMATDDTAASVLSNLVLVPPYRGHRERLGSFLTLVCLHFIGLHRSWFADRLVAEIVPPSLHERRETLWEHLGRRFINLPLAEAQRFRMQSGEFVQSLFPRDEIYVSLLPAAARNLIGSVAPEAQNARALLEKCGFAYRDRIEPFCGGPILDAAVEEVPLIAATRATTLGDPQPTYPHRGLVSTLGGGRFRAVRTPFAQTADRISIPGDAAGLLGAQVGDSVGVSETGPET